MAMFDLEKFNLSYARWYFRSSQKQRHRLYRKLQGMLAMNEPLPRALERLWLNASQGGKKPTLPVAVLIKDWMMRFREGASLAEAMFGAVPDRDLMMIRAGEESGALGDALAGIQVIDTAAKGMRAAISKAMTYPILLFFMMGGVLWMFGITLIDPLRDTAPPHVLEQLAGLTAVSDFIRQYGIITVIVIAILIGLLIAALPNWRGKMRIKFDKVPPWAWYRIWQGSSFLLGMSALLKSQVPLKRALEILESQSRPWLKERVGLTRLAVLEGKNLGEALRATGTDFPDPQIALDLEILAERGDVGQIIDAVTKEWLEDQTEKLNIQANIVRTIGMALVGLVIAWAMLSIMGITQQVQKGGI